MFKSKIDNKGEVYDKIDNNYLITWLVAEAKSYHWKRTRDDPTDSVL